MANEVTVTVKMTRSFRLPTLPNYLHDAAGNTVPVQELTQEQLREIGQAWTEALMRKARAKAGEAIARINRSLAKEYGR